MEKKNYFNFMAFRKALYDSSLSERARLVYIHLLQKSSSKGCADKALYNDVELTKELIAIDLGILTKSGEPSIKLVQRALEELEEHGYIKRFQKFKSKGCPLTIRLNLSQQFLRKNNKQIEESEEEYDSSFDETESGFVHHYNPSLIPSNLSKSTTNPSNISEEDFEEACGFEVEFNWSDELLRIKARIAKASTVEEIMKISRDLNEKQDSNEVPTELEEELNEVQNMAKAKVYKLKASYA